MIMLIDKDATKDFRCRCIRWTDDQLEPIKVAREVPLTILLNDQELVTLLCSPGNEQYLAVGFLASEGYIQSAEELKHVLTDTAGGIVRVSTQNSPENVPKLMFKRVVASACGRCAAFYNAADAISKPVISQNKISIGQIEKLVQKFQKASNLRDITHGVHGAALCDNSDLLVMSEDIGRHNAVDKVFGKCLIEKISVSGKLIILSGRVSSEMVYKVTKREIPIIMSVAAPTDLGIELCEQLGVTLITAVRNDSMNIFTHSWRVTPNEG